MGLKKVGVQLVAEGSSVYERALNSANTITDKFGSVASKASGGVDKLSVATVALGTAVGGVISAGISKVVDAITSFVGSGFDLNNSLEQATAKLVAFTGSADAAATVLEMVKARAAATPFEFDEMANSAAGLAAVAKTSGESLEGLLGIAERLAASNPAEGLEGAAFALREAFSGDFVSLQDRFNIPKDLIKRIKEGGITVAELDAELAAMGITTDLVGNLAATSEGRISTFNDSITELAGSLTNPVFEAWKTILEELQPIIDKNKDGIKEFGSSIGRAVGDKVLKIWGQLRDAVITFQMAFEGKWVDSDIIQPFHRVAGVVGSIVGQFDLVGDAIRRLMEGKSIDSYVDAIVRNLAEAFGVHLNTEQFNQITDTINNVIDKVVEFGRIAKEVFDGFSNGGIAGGLAALQPYVEEAFSRIIAYVQSQLPTWQANLTKWGEAAWKWIEENAIPPIQAKLSEWAEAVKGYVLSKLPEWQGVLEGWATAAWQWIVNSAMQIPQRVTDWVNALIEQYKTNLPTWSTSFWDWATESVKWLGDAIPDLIIAAGDWLAALVGWFLSEGLPGLLVETDKMQDASVQWIEDAVPLLWPKFVLFLAEVSKSLQKIQEAIGEAAVKIGVAIIAGIISGLLSVAHQIGDALGSVISAEIQRAIQEALANTPGVTPVDPDKGVGGGTAPKSSTPSTSPNYTNSRVDAPPTSYGAYSNTVSTTNSVSIPITIYGGGGDVAAQVEYGVTRSLRAAGLN